MSFYLGVDQGSHSTKALLVNRSGEVVWGSSINVTPKFIDTIKVEQSLQEIRDSILTLIKEALSYLGDKGSIVRIGFALQRSGVAAWEESTGEVVHELITWRDRRTYSCIDRLKESHSYISEKTGLPVTAHYAAGKYSLLQERFANEGILVGTLDTYLFNTLLNERPFITEDTMASRTLLYSLATKQWDPELCRLFSVNIRRLPKIVSGIGFKGKIKNIPVYASLGDQQASLIGIRGGTDEAVINLGTIASVCVGTGGTHRVVRGYVNSVLLSRYDNYQSNDPLSDPDSGYEFLIEGITNTSGDIIRIITSELKLAASLDEINSMCEAASVDTVVYLPLNGTATPDWRYDIEGLIYKFDSESPSSLVRALIENIGNFVVMCTQTLVELEYIRNDSKLKIAGGLASLSYLVSYISERVGTPLYLAESDEATARGAALSVIPESSLEFDLYQKNLHGLNKRETLIKLSPSVNKEGIIKRASIWSELRDVAYGEAAYFNNVSPFDEIKKKYTQ